VHLSLCAGGQRQCLDEWVNLFGSDSPPLAAQTDWMSEYIHKSHNVTVLLYHLVFPAKYQRTGI